MAVSRALLVVTVTVGCALAPAFASRVARAGPADELTLFLHTGVNLGVSINDEADDGFVLGGETSLVLLHFDDDDQVEHDAPGVPAFGDASWVGMYADVIRDTASDTTRLSLGPELGHELIGIDGGVLAQLGDDRRWGLTVRPALTFGFATLYGRWGHFLDDRPDPDVVEGGLLVKLPLRLWGRRL